jgi:acetyl esterase/lipase
MGRKRGSVWAVSDLLINLDEEAALGRRILLASGNNWRARMRSSMSIAAGLAVGCLMLAAPADAQSTAFYAASVAELAGEPGSLIRSEALFGAPLGSKAYRVLYRSTGLQGQRIAVSGVVVVPNAAPPSGGHPVVAWAHPTTGVATKCAPSLKQEVMYSIPGLDDMLKRGFAVTATDYPGLGTIGEHPYLVGISEGRAVLDSVRAVRALVGASERFAVWGHSQGGHAALWTGEIAVKYAPELKIVGVAAAAPASELALLFEDDLTTKAGEGLTSLTLWSWSRLYDMPLQAVVKPTALVDVAAIGGECLAGFSDLITDVRAVDNIQTVGFLAADPVKTKPWTEIIAGNTPGRGAPGAPVFIAQGTDDTIVDPPVTTAFADTLCRQGAAVRLLRVPGATHQQTAKLSASAAIEWMAARFAGEAAPTDCVRK